MGTRRFILLSATSCAFLLSCEDDPTVPSKQPVVETHVIRDVDYIKDTFFLLDDPAAFLGAIPYSVEVYQTVTPQDLITDPTIVVHPGFAVPDSTPEGTAIGQAMAALNAGSRPSPVLLQNFRRLVRGTDYSILMTADTVAVGIEMEQPVPAAEMRTLAVRYRNQLAEVIGASFADTLVLEMIKAPDPRPDGQFGSTWELMMRNAYDLGFGAIDPQTLSVVIKDDLSPRPSMSRPEGSAVPYAQIFGIDQDGAPDGRIDNVFLGWDDDLQRSILWFPVLNAFTPPAERVQVWTEDEFAFSGAYLSQYQMSSRIYTERLSASEAQTVHQYDIHATVTLPPQ